MVVSAPVTKSTQSSLALVLPMSITAIWRIKSPEAGLFSALEASFPAGSVRVNHIDLKYSSHLSRPRNEGAHYQQRHVLAPTIAHLLPLSAFLRPYNPLAGETATGSQLSDRIAT